MANEELCMRKRTKRRGRKGRRKSRRRRGGSVVGALKTALLPFYFTRHKNICKKRNLKKLKVEVLKL